MESYAITQWFGTTSQGRFFRMTLANGEPIEINFDFTILDCDVRPAVRLRYYELQGFVIDSMFQIDEVDVNITGHFVSPSRAEGTAIITPTHCDSSAEVTWEAGTRNNFV